LAAYGDGRVVSEALLCITLDFNFFALANLGFFLQIPTKGSLIRHGGKQIRKY
jgi:hypothetical protein